MKLFLRNLFIFLALTISLNSVVAKEQQTIEADTLSQLMNAIAQNDFDDFVSQGNDQFKKGISKQVFKTVVKQYGQALQSGYVSTYLAELNQQGNKVHLWKISYENTSENSLAKLVLIENKVAGFWLL